MTLTTTNRAICHLIIIGCGLHFRERHYPALCKSALANDVKIKLVVDLESEAEKVDTFFVGKPIQASNFLFLPKHQRTNVDVQHFHQKVKEKVDLLKVDGVLICTEPKAHKAFILWAIENNLAIFVDKPLTAFSSYEDMETLYQDYIEIEKARAAKDLHFVLCCERRDHAGYQYLIKEIKKIIEEFHVPITFIRIDYGDGLWVMPDEYVYRENHPYKYGYGVLLHSGYHYIDLLCQFIHLNLALFPLCPNESKISTQLMTPYYSLKSIQNIVYQRCLNTNRFEPYFSEAFIDSIAHYGATDAIITGSFDCQGRPLTLFNLNLNQTSISRRNWHQLPENTYLENGRTHLESLQIHLGNLCTIEVSINPYLKQKEGEGFIENFDVRIMKNPSLNSKTQFVQLNRRDISLLVDDLKITESMNIKARAKQLDNFLNGVTGNSSLPSHDFSIAMLAKIYQEIASNRRETNRISENNIRRSLFV